MALSDDTNSVVSAGVDGWVRYWDTKSIVDAEIDTDVSIDYVLSPNLNSASPILKLDVLLIGCCMEPRMSPITLYAILLVLEVISSGCGREPTASSLPVSVSHIATARLTTE